ncbi:MAG TPA: 16S rRNA (cytidine(1402)-2'-O)-methyltransferase [Acidimicrobiia bacterium]|nr:16S rRNA (cytidine(1402)-2'-O)-methyltransferase [Acidimicrobiia bacterium]
MTGGGALVLVATPIGNLGDLSRRAVEELRDADVIAAEDTRRTRALLSACDISAGGRLRAVHAHNERTEAQRIVEQVREGKRVVFVSDAGTPGIADPGERLARACLDEGLTVEAVPGPSALLAALVVSGLPTARFRFEGFLPRKGAERAERLRTIVHADSTVVLFEAPHRIHATLDDLVGVVGVERRACVARELTKRYEDVVRGPLGEVVTAVRSRGEARGEYVVVLDAAAPSAVPDPAAVAAAVASAMASGASARDAAAEVAAELGVSRRAAYEAAVRVRDSLRRS